MSRKWADAKSAQPQAKGKTVGEALRSVTPEKVVKAPFQLVGSTYDKVVNPLIGSPQEMFTEGVGKDVASRMVKKGLDARPGQFTHNFKDLDTPFDLNVTSPPLNTRNDLSGSYYKKSTNPLNLLRGKPITNTESLIDLDNQTDLSLAARSRDYPKAHVQLPLETKNKLSFKHSTPRRSFWDWLRGKPRVNRSHIKLNSDINVKPPVYSPELKEMMFDARKFGGPMTKDDHPKAFGSKFSKILEGMDTDEFKAKYPGAVYDGGEGAVEVGFGNPKPKSTYSGDEKAHWQARINRLRENERRAKNNLPSLPSIPPSGDPANLKPKINTERWNAKPKINTERWNAPPKKKPDGVAMSPITGYGKDPKMGLSNFRRADKQRSLDNL